MNILLLAAVAAATPTALDAERALIRDVQRLGQWSALRAHADQDAVIMTPQAEWADEFLKGRENPAGQRRWSPNTSFVSCDGNIAINTGPWKSADGLQSGYFTTVWQREKGQWRWLYHGQEAAGRPIAARRTPVVRKASCRGRPPGAPLMSPPSTKKGPRGAKPDDFGRGQSADRTFGWDWRVGQKNLRHIRIFLWTGRRYEVALNQKNIGR